MIYSFKWKQSESWILGGDKRPDSIRLKFLYKCCACEQDIPEKSTTLIITASGNEQLHTSRICMDCVGAITKENLKNPPTRSE